MNKLLDVLAYVPSITSDAFSFQMAHYHYTPSIGNVILGSIQLVPAMHKHYSHEWFHLLVAYTFVLISALINMYVRSTIQGIERDDGR